KPGIQRVAICAASLGLARIHLSASETAERNFSIVSPFFSTQGRKPTLKPRYEIVSPPRITSTAPGTSFTATIGHGSQHEKASMPLASSATVISGGGVLTSVTSAVVRPVFSSTARI